MHGDVAGGEDVRGPTCGSAQSTSTPPSHSSPASRASSSLGTRPTPTTIASHAMLAAVAERDRRAALAPCGRSRSTPAPSRSRRPVRAVQRQQVLGDLAPARCARTAGSALRRRSPPRPSCARSPPLRGRSSRRHDDHAGACRPTGPRPAPARRRCVRRVKTPAGRHRALQACEPDRRCTGSACRSGQARPRSGRSSLADAVDARHADLGRQSSASARRLPASPGRWCSRSALRRRAPPSTSGGRSCGGWGSSPIRTIRPVKPSLRSVCAAQPPAWPAPMMTMVCAAHAAAATQVARIMGLLGSASVEREPDAAAFDLDRVAADRLGHRRAGRLPVAHVELALVQAGIRSRGLRGSLRTAGRGRACRCCRWRRPRRPRCTARCRGHRRPRRSRRPPARRSTAAASIQLQIAHRWPQIG